MPSDDGDDQMDENALFEILIRCRDVRHPRICWAIRGQPQVGLRRFSSMSEQIHNHQYPMRSQAQRFTTKQVCGTFVSSAGDGNAAGSTVLGPCHIAARRNSGPICNSPPTGIHLVERGFADYILAPRDTFLASSGKSVGDFSGGEGLRKRGRFGRRNSKGVA
jgi:hypothetical protein